MGVEFCLCVAAHNFGLSLMQETEKINRPFRLFVFVLTFDMSNAARPFDDPNGHGARVRPGIQTSYLHVHVVPPLTPSIKLTIVHAH